MIRTRVLHDKSLYLIIYIHHCSWLGQLLLVQNKQGRKEQKQYLGYITTKEAFKG